MKRLGYFNNIPESYSLQRATSLYEYKSFFEFVSYIYKKSCIIPQDAPKAYVRKFESNPDNAYFYIKKENTVVGTMSVVCDTKAHGLPAETVFPEEVAYLRKISGGLVEYSTYAIDDCKDSKSFTCSLLQALTIHQLLKESRPMVFVMSPNHLPFFETLGARQASEIKNYSSDSDDPVLLLYWDYSNIHSKWEKGYLFENCEESSFFYNYFFLNNPYREHVEQWEDKVQKLWKSPAHRWAMKDMLGVNRVVSFQTSQSSQMAPESTNTIRGMSGAFI